MKNNYAVILAGGRGERFWPLSTAARPKQFISLFGGKPLITLALERLEGLVPPERVLIITSADLLEATAAAAPELPEANLIGEPCGRDTAAAVALACGIVAARDADGVAAILTADQLMEDVAVFRQTLSDCFAAARLAPNIVTIGIPPTYPATGFGYIEAGAELDLALTTPFNTVRRFVEKPDEATAASYLADGTYLWNAGMFIWHVNTMAAAVRKFTPELLPLLELPAHCATARELHDRLDETYPGLAKISVDYAIMERTDNIVVARGGFGWDDVGTWPAVAAHFAPDESGNIIIGTGESLDSSGNIVVSQERMTAIVGVEDLVVIQSPTATLICPRDRAQEVRQMVRQIAERPDAGSYL